MWQARRRAWGGSGSEGEIGATKGCHRRWFSQVLVAWLRHQWRCWTQWMSWGCRCGRDRRKYSKVPRGTSSLSAVGGDKVFHPFNHFFLVLFGFRTQDPRFERLMSVGEFSSLDLAFLQQPVPVKGQLDLDLLEAMPFTHQHLAAEVRIIALAVAAGFASTAFAQGAAAPATPAAPAAKVAAPAPAAAEKKVEAPAASAPAKTEAGRCNRSACN